MRINFNDLKKLSVETASGQPLGKIIDSEIDLSTHTVSKYIVAPNQWLGHKQKLLIAPAQIIEINTAKIIVDDAVIRQMTGNSISGLRHQAVAGNRINYDG